MTMRFMMLVKAAKESEAGALAWASRVPFTSGEVVVDEPSRRAANR
jgi:hypothetical protein